MSAKSEQRKKINELAEHWMQVALHCESDPIVFVGHTSYQKRPYTCVQVMVRWQNGPNDIIRVEGLGFSKVNWPDPWEEQHGVELALRKACFSAAQSVFDYYHPDAPPLPVPQTV